MLAPLEQFKIIPIISLNLPGGYDISFTNSALSMVLVLLVIVYLFLSSMRLGKLIPGRWQSFIEMIYEFVFSIVHDNLGKKGMSYFPFIFALFTFILFANLLGLVPYSFTATTHIAITFAFSFSIFIYVTVLGFVKHGIRFFGFFFPDGVHPGMAPFIVVIEFLSYFARPLSLGIRLFANMMSGHTLFKIMAGFSWSMLQMGGAIYVAGFLPLVFLVVFTGLEMGICCIQAYVFAILTVLYIKDAIYLH